MVLTKSKSKPVKEMTEDESKVYKNIIDKNKGMIKLGYKRITEKLKSIRQTATPYKRSVKYVVPKGRVLLGTRDHINVA